MLFNAYKTYPYTVDYYSYTLITSADGTVTEKRYSTIPQEIKVAISTSFIGDLIIIAREKLQKNGRLANLIDRNGTEIYPEAIWEITSTMPRTSPVGFVEGFKYKAKIISGNV